MSIKKRAYVKDMATIAMCTSVIIISSWIAIPFAVSITMQLAAIFIISLLFGLKISLASVLLYIFIGFCGLPVFSGFNSGLSAILGPTGGFIIGFIFIPVIINAFKLSKTSAKMSTLLSMLFSLLACYALGVIWYWKIYARTTDVGFIGAFSVCVVPFLIPDILKIFLSIFIVSKLKNHIK